MKALSTVTDIKKNYSKLVFLSNIYWFPFIISLTFVKIFSASFMVYSFRSRHLPWDISEQSCCFLYAFKFKRAFPWAVLPLTRLHGPWVTWLGSWPHADRAPREDKSCAEVTLQVSWQPVHFNQAGILVQCWQHCVFLSLFCLSELFVYMFSHNCV